MERSLRALYSEVIGKRISMTTGVWRESLNLKRYAAAISVGCSAQRLRPLGIDKT